MKTTAARLVAHGQPLAVAEVKVPAPGPGAVLVEMLYGGINPVDRYRAAGTVDGGSRLPRILGAEGIGTADGQVAAVFGHGVGTTRDGIWAGQAVVPRSALVELPDGTDPRQAAVMGAAGVTAWRTVTELAEVTAADRVLVLGAAAGWAPSSCRWRIASARPYGRRPAPHGTPNGCPAWGRTGWSAALRATWPPRQPA